MALVLNLVLAVLLACISWQAKLHRAQRNNHMLKLALGAGVRRPCRRRLYRPQVTASPRGVRWLFEKWRCCS